MPEILTPAELKVLALLVEGLNNKEIAKELNVSLSTVKAQVGSILRKLNLRNRTLAAVYAAMNNLFG